jgi:hypothetical protein
MLERYYVEQFGQMVRMVDFRPSSNPLVQLTVALRTLTKSLRASFDPTPDAIVHYIKEHTADGQVNLLVLDQFEELFTQSDAAERDVLFALLTSLPPFAETLTHIVATMRSDFLPELFAHKQLYTIAKQGIDLYAMQLEELRRAILQPLQQRYPDGEKRFEGALLDKLAAEAAQDASYLPLLQVTLERLWDKGSLKLSAYGVDGTLADALRQRADDVYTYLDHATDKRQPRPDAERTTIMQIFLDLVNVSLDDNARRDVRCRRSYADVAQGSAERERLIEELCAARLLSRQIERTEAGAGEELDQVDIIHEALIRSWDRLTTSVSARLSWGIRP